MRKQPAAGAFVLASAALLAVTAHSQTLQTLYSFKGPPDGANPYAEMILVDSVLYGTTSFGGAYDQGAVFAFNPTTGTESILYSFKGGNDGSMPITPLTYHDGMLFGTTYGGGVSTACQMQPGCGTVFQIDIKTGAEKVLYSFVGGNDGEFPASGLLIKDGYLYGTTQNGGSSTCGVGVGAPGCGIVFQVQTATGAEKILHAFNGDTDGNGPTGKIAFLDGDIYGTTASGGQTTETSNVGTVFRIDPATGSEKVIYSFGAHESGLYPFAGLTYINGLLFGATTLGSTLFSVSATHGVHIIYSFGESTGSQDTGGVTLNPNSVHHGIAARSVHHGVAFSPAQDGGTKNKGTVFSFDFATLNGQVIANFTGGKDGANPLGGITFVGPDAFGTTLLGGAAKTSYCTSGQGCGTIYKLTQP